MHNGFLTYLLIKHILLITVRFYL